MFNEKCGVADVFDVPNLPDLYRTIVPESMSQVLQVPIMYETPALYLSHLIFWMFSKFVLFYHFYIS